MQEISTNSYIETEKIGQVVGEALKTGDVVCLSGDLGVGKTAFVKGLAKGIGITEHITSPTFTIVNEYQGKYKLYHFDVYRVNDSDELNEIGFEEYIYGDGISVIEWAEIIKDILPQQKLWIEITKDLNISDDYRKIIFNCYGEKYKKILDQLNLTWGE